MTDPEPSPGSGKIPVSKLLDHIENCDWDDPVLQGHLGDAEPLIRRVIQSLIILAASRTPIIGAECGMGVYLEGVDRNKLDQTPPDSLGVTYVFVCHEAIGKPLREFLSAVVQPYADAAQRFREQKNPPGELE